MKTALSTYIQYSCSILPASEKVIETYIETVEQKLAVESSELRIQNMTTENLETAAKMFVYLVTCPVTNSWQEWFKSWDLFYTDLFNEKTHPYQIMLTLNRMMNVRYVNNNDGKVRAEKLFIRITNYLSLKYGAIQSLLPLGTENIINSNISTSIKS